VSALQQELVEALVKAGLANPQIEIAIVDSLQRPQGDRKVEALLSACAASRGVVTGQGFYFRDLADARRASFLC
jgi:hypothetical protein